MLIPNMCLEMGLVTGKWVIFCVLIHIFGQTERRKIDTDEVSYDFLFRAKGSKRSKQSKRSKRGLTINVSLTLTPSDSKRETSVTSPFSTAHRRSHASDMLECHAENVVQVCVRHPGYQMPRMLLFLLRRPRGRFPPSMLTRQPGSFAQALRPTMQEFLDREPRGRSAR